MHMENIFFPLLATSRLRMGTDGKGVTTLVAGAGCPLSCQYCINKRLLKEAPIKRVTAEELIEKVRIDDLYFRATGGGVTFGGGESLLHSAFICRFRELCPPEWRIAAETSLAVPRENLPPVLAAVDEFVVDCKDMDPDTYHRYTGGDAGLMMDNLKFLLASCGADRILVRVPRIPGFNSEEDQIKSAETLRKMGFTRLDLFDYVIRSE